MNTSNRPVTVLVVDPNPQQRALLAQILTPRCSILQAETLAQAASHLVTQQPEVIIVERELPDGDGLSFVRQVRNDPRLSEISIACVTNRAEVRDKIEGFRAGVDDYVIKPVDPAVFLQRIVLLTRVRRLTS